MSDKKEAPATEQKKQTKPKPAPAPKPRKEQRAQQRIYVGPSIRALGLVHATVFKGDLPRRVQDAIARAPDLERLIVDVSKAPVALRDAGTEGTAYHIISQRVAAKLATKEV